MTSKLISLRTTGLILGCTASLSLGVGLFAGNQETKKESEFRKLSAELDKTWWSTKPHMGNCGNCQDYAMIRPQDSGMYCEKC